MTTEDAAAVIARSVSSEAIHLAPYSVLPWIASWSLSSGARSRDPLARNDGKTWVLIAMTMEG
jgi:hypothetical protein